VARLTGGGSNKLSRSKCIRRRKDLFPSSRAAAGDKGVGTSAHGRGGVNHGYGQTVGEGGTVVWVRAVYARECWWFGQWAQASLHWGGLILLGAGAWYCSIGPGRVKTFSNSKGISK
jgi:hypothetical protein